MIGGKKKSFGEIPDLMPTCPSEDLTLAAIGSIPGLHGEFCVTCIEYFSTNARITPIILRQNFSLLKHTQK